MPTIHNAAFSDSPNTNVKHDLKTDKLTLVNDLPDMLKEGIVSYYLGLIKDQELIAYHAISRSYSPGCRGYEVSLEGKVPLKTSPLIWSTEAGYLLQVGGKKGRPTLRLDINPLALTLTG